MKRLSSRKLLSVFVLTAAVFFISNSFAGSFPMEEKLKQCEMAFEQAQSGKLSQAEAWKARREHKKLAREILASLNKQNAEITTISNEEILNNLRVMGRLLEMLAADHPTMQDEWGYPLVR
jgi:hypothetical protein